MLIGLARYYASCLSGIAKQGQKVYPKRIQLTMVSCQNFVEGNPTCFMEEM